MSSTLVVVVVLVELVLVVDLGFAATFTELVEALDFSVVCLFLTVSLLTVSLGSVLGVVGRTCTVAVVFLRAVLGAVECTCTVVVVFLGAALAAVGRTDAVVFLGAGFAAGFFLGLHKHLVILCCSLNSVLFAFLH